MVNAGQQWRLGKGGIVGDATGEQGVAPRWRDDPARLIHVPAAEAWCGWTFADQSLAVVALHHSMAGFSRLEFLGDAVLNLTVYSVMVDAGRTPAAATRVVANDNLDRCLAAGPLAGEVPSGDVIETLVGAVHLDGGFTAAWQAALRLVGSSADVPTDVGPPPGTVDWSRLGLRARAFIGSAVLRAAVADHLCRRNPGWTQARFSRSLGSLLRTDRVAQRAAAVLGDRWREAPDRDLLDDVQAEAAERFLAEGWDAAVAVAHELELTDR